MRPVLKKQGVPYDPPDSKWLFDPEADVAVAITLAEKAIYNDYAYELLAILTELAKRHGGLDWLQIFMNPDPNLEDLVVQEAEDAIVFHLPSENSSQCVDRRYEPSSLMCHRHVHFSVSLSWPMSRPGMTL